MTQANNSRLQINPEIIPLKSTFHFTVLVLDAGEKKLLESLLTHKRLRRKDVIEELLITAKLIKDSPVSILALSEYSEKAEQIIEDWDLPKGVNRLTPVPIKISIDRYVTILGYDVQDKKNNLEIFRFLLAYDEVRHYLCFKYYAETNHYQIKLDDVLAECPEAKKILESLLVDDGGEEPEDRGDLDNPLRQEQEFSFLGEDVLRESEDTDFSGEPNRSQSSEKADKESSGGWFKWPWRSRKVDSHKVSDGVKVVSSHMAIHGIDRNY